MGLLNILWKKGRELLDSLFGRSVKGVGRKSSSASVEGMKGVSRRRGVGGSGRKRRGYGLGSEVGREKVFEGARSARPLRIGAGGSVSTGVNEAKRVSGRLMVGESLFKESNLVEIRVLKGAAGKGFFKESESGLAQDEEQKLVEPKQVEPELGESFSRRDEVLQAMGERIGSCEERAKAAEADGTVFEEGLIVSASEGVEAIAARVSEAEEKEWFKESERVIEQEDAERKIAAPELGESVSEREGSLSVIGEQRIKSAEPASPSEFDRKALYETLKAFEEGQKAFQEEIRGYQERIMQAEERIMQAAEGIMQAAEGIMQAEQRIMQAEQRIMQAEQRILQVRIDQRETYLLAEMLLKRLDRLLESNEEDNLDLPISYAHSSLSMKKN